MEILRNLHKIKVQQSTLIAKCLKRSNVGPLSSHESGQGFQILVSWSIHSEQWMFIPVVPETFPTRPTTAEAGQGTRAWSCPDHSLHRPHLLSNRT